MAFIQKEKCVFQISKSPNKSCSKSLSWGWKLNKLFTIIGRKFKFQVQDSDLEYFVFRDLEIWKMHFSFWIKANDNKSLKHLILILPCVIWRANRAKIECLRTDLKIGCTNTLNLCSIFLIKSQGAILTRRSNWIKTWLW